MKMHMTRRGSTSSVLHSDPNANYDSMDPTMPLAGVACVKPFSLNAFARSMPALIF